MQPPTADYFDYAEVERPDAELLWVAPSRAWGVLTRLGCKNVSDLRGLTQLQIIRAKGCGARTFEEIKSLAGRYGIEIPLA